MSDDYNEFEIYWNYSIDPSVFRTVLNVKLVLIMC